MPCESKQMTPQPSADLRGNEVFPSNPRPPENPIFLPDTSAGPFRRTIKQ